MNYKILTLIVALIMMISSFVFLYPIYEFNQKSNADYFKNNEVQVDLIIEEGLDIMGARSIALVAFESINRTFNYSFSLGVIITIPEDNITIYSFDYLNETFWDIGGKKGLENNCEDGTLTMELAFFSGKFPGFTGISNRGPQIAIFCHNPLVFKLNFFTTCKTVLHEFGHAFGLGHNKDSIMMYNSEVDPECNPFNWTNYPNHFSQYFVGNLVTGLNNTSFQEYYNNSETMYKPEMYCWFLEKEFMENSSHPNGDVFRDITYYEKYEVNYFVCLRNGNFTNVTIFNEVFIYYYDYDTYAVHTQIDATTFNAMEYSKFWTQEEISLCKD